MSAIEPVSSDAAQIDLAHAPVVLTCDASTTVSGFLVGALVEYERAAVV